jgi:hypothetical protein
VIADFFQQVLQIWAQQPIQPQVAPPVLDTEMLEGFWKWSLLGLMGLTALSFGVFLISFFSPQLKPTAAALFAHLPGRKKKDGAEKAIPTKSDLEGFEEKTEQLEPPPESDSLETEKAAIAAALADLPPPPASPAPKSEPEGAAEKAPLEESPADEIPAEIAEEVAEEVQKEIAEEISEEIPDQIPEEVAEEFEEPTVSEAPSETPTPEAEVSSAPEVEEEVFENPPAEEIVEEVIEVEDLPEETKEEEIDLDLDDITGDIEKAMTEPFKDDKTEILSSTEALPLPEDEESDETEVGEGERVEAPIFDPSVLDEVLESDDDFKDKP